MHIVDDIPAGPKVPDLVNVVVEIPRGSQNKYEFDKKSGLLMLDRVLFSAVHYPADYGIIPQTLADDGDALDALVLVSNPTYPGTLVAARPLGMLTMIDAGEGDDKILCAAVKDVRLANLTDITDVSQGILNEISTFFGTYKQLEGKTVKIQGWENAAAAKKAITKAVEAYKKRK